MVHLIYVECADVYQFLCVNANFFSKYLAHTVDVSLIERTEYVSSRLLNRFFHT